MMKKRRVKQPSLTPTPFTDADRRSFEWMPTHVHQFFTWKDYVPTQQDCECGAKNAFQVSTDKKRLSSLYADKLPNSHN